MPLLALLVLGFRLGKVQVDVGIVRPRLLRHAAYHALGRRVLAVDAHVDFDAPAPGVLVIREELPVDRRDRQAVIVGLDEAHRSAVGVICLHARLKRRVGTVDSREVHVRVAYDAIAQHLRLGEHRAPVVVLALHVHLALERPDRLVEPLLQRLVFGVPAQKRHGRVRVCVVEGGHEELARAVVALPEPLGPLGLRISHIGYRVALDPDEHVLLVVEVLVKNIDVAEKHMSVPSH